MPKAVQTDKATFVLGPEAIASGQTLAHIGSTMVAPATFTQGASQRGGGRLHLPLEVFKEVICVVKFTFSYTGGTTNPNMYVYLQRKIDATLPDTDDLAWEDFAAVTSSITDTYIMRAINASIGSRDNEDNIPNLAKPLLRDNTNLVNGVRPGFLGPKSRLRVRFQANGDRTGGTCTLDVVVTGFNPDGEA